MDSVVSVGERDGAAVSAARRETPRGVRQCLGQVPGGHPDLTFGRQEKECPLGRCGLHSGETLCRAALHLQDCQGQKPKPLSRMRARCQPSGAETAHGCHSAGHDCWASGQKQSPPNGPITSPRARSGAWHAWGASSVCCPQYRQITLCQSGLWDETARACPCLSHLLCEGLISGQVLGGFP